MTNKALMGYNQEIQTILRNLQRQKDLLKDFVDNDEGYQDLVAVVKEAQEAVKAYVAESERGKELQEKIKDLSNDFKQAVKAAEKAAVVYKAKELKAFFVARSKDKVEEAVVKGSLFDVLTKELE